MWFDILKVLGTKSGYAQLDFDNIVEEEEADCKRKVKELVDRFSNLRFKGYKRRNLRDGRTIHNKPNTRLDIWHDFDDSFPEEVYCKILEFIKSPNEVEAEIGDVYIKKIVVDVPDNSYPMLELKENIIAVYRKVGGGQLVVGYSYRFVKGDEEIIPKLEEAFNVV